VAERIAAEVSTKELGLVTHSMGGILARHMDTLLSPRRVVMLAMASPFFSRP